MPTSNPTDRCHSSYLGSKDDERVHGDGQRVNQFPRAVGANDDSPSLQAPQRPHFLSMAMQSHIPLSSLRYPDPVAAKTSSSGCFDDSLYDYRKDIIDPCSPLVREVIKNQSDHSIVPSRLSAGCWATDKLRRMGYYHPLEPSHVSFPRKALLEILNRLTNLFKVLSCRVLYDDDLLSAACQTMEQVEFQVSLYESRQDKQTCLLELQRRAGDSYIFHHDYAQPILAVVNGEEPAERKPPMKRMSGQMMDRLAQHVGVTDEDIDVAIELATNLITADRIDACRLGMESLEALTDASKTGVSTARKVARELVSPSGGTSEKLVQTMLKYLLSSQGTDDLAFRALQIWANAWRVAADDLDTPLETFCDTACDRDSLMSCLMHHVENVHQQPHEATLALQGLAALCREIPHLRGAVSWEAVKQANVVGEAENDALELASRKFLEAR